MELDITEFYTTADPFNYAASVAEIGGNAGRITWQAACDADFNLLDNDEKREAFRDHLKCFGAWDTEEITAFSDNELNALLIQLISGDIRESCLEDNPEDWQGYYSQSEAGQVSGRLYASDGKVYYYIGN